MSADSPKTTKKKSAAGAALLMGAVLLVTAGGVALWFFVIEPMLNKKDGKGKDKPPDIGMPGKPEFKEPDEKLAEIKLMIRAKRQADMLKFETDYRDGLRKDAGDSAALRVLKSSGGTARLLTYSPDGMYLAAARGGAITLWSARGEDAVKTWKTDKGEITSLVVGAGGNGVIYGDDKGFEKMWQTAEGKTTKEAKRSGKITAQCLVPESAHIFSAIQVFSKGEASELIHWTIDDEPIETTCKNPPPGIRCLAFSPDERHLISGEAESVTVWNPYKGEARKKIPLKKGEHALSLAVTPDAKSAVVAVTDFKSGRLALIDLNTGEDKTLAEVPGAHLVEVAYDGKAYVVSAKADDSAGYHLYDVESGKLTKLLEVPKGSGAMALSPFAMFLAVPDGDEVTLWDVERLRMKK